MGRIEIRWAKRESSVRRDLGAPRLNGEEMLLSVFEKLNQIEDIQGSEGI